MQVKKTFSYFLLLLVPFFSPSSYFEKIFGTSGNDYARSVKQLSDGSIYLFGDTDSGKYGGNDLSLIKLDKDGNLLWTKYYGSANSENGFCLNTTTDKNLVFVGEQLTATSTDIVIYKVDTSGTVIWNKTYSTTLNESANYIEQTSDGGYIIAGSQNDSLGYFDLFILKLNSSGDYQWHKTFGPDRNEYAKMIHAVKDGYILIGDMGDSLNSYDVIVYKLDSLGNKVWAKSYGDSLVNGSQGLITTSDGNYLLYGETEPAQGERFDGYLEKIDANGTSLWKNTYGGTGADAVFSVKETTDGGFVCTGYSNSSNNNAPLDVLVFKTDPLGKLSWQQTYGGSGIDIGYELVKNYQDNGFIIAGTTFSNADDYYLLQLNETGIITTISTPDKTGTISTMKLYPNPSSEHVTINYEWNGEGKNGTLLIQDVMGHTLNNIVLIEKKGTIAIDTRNFNPGIYFCSLLSGQQLIFCERLLIK